MPPPVILFDGVCNLCNGFIQFVIKNDRQGVFRFASLQSEAASSLLGDRASAYRDSLETVVLIEGDTIYTHSDVALQIARRIGGAWSLLLVAYILPKFCRDALYRFIARNRYRWFGKHDTCMVPSPDLASRFL